MEHRHCGAKLARSRLFPPLRQPTEELKQDYAPGSLKHVLGPEMSIPVLAPTPAKRSKSSDCDTCIICKKPCKEERSSFDLTAWENLKQKAYEWEGEQIDYENFVHDVSIIISKETYSD